MEWVHLVRKRRCRNYIRVFISYTHMYVSLHFHSTGISNELKTTEKQRYRTVSTFHVITQHPSIHNHMYSFQVNQPVSHNVWQHNVFRKSVQTSRECRRNELTACLICHAKWHPIPYSETKQNSTETEPLPKPDGLIVREQFNNDLNA